ncbi:hypothetical protein AKJ64_00930 [candidate division MSBL1 archaeon SCGC-AAA259E17]|uniref:GIY-YIG domain-containing protein n=1 Tax=candidate division MSBL1 archaeon SCGC-AAA259E17 TaxID=1698263 RepID=A0A133UGG7_9EURY|nr:hypothetical protein AKJ64_00930 [candidate division MSBL1 archaeon SCGC-AAA259E17]
MSEKCEWLHEKLEKLPKIQYPFEKSSLPKNGIYFFYEKGETWGHDGNKPRIVRVGTHKSGNFRSRISEHFLFEEERKMDFDQNDSKPSDRSIFRKNIGRALLNKDDNDYLKVWNIDFIKRKNREEHASKRNISKEREIERKITEILRENFSFRFIAFEGGTNIMGKEGLESNLIGTLGQCSECKPSKDWLGNSSSKPKIRESGLWLIQHLKDSPIDEADKKVISDSIKKSGQKFY